MYPHWKTVIIDDEPAARRSMLRLVKAYPHVLQLAGEAGSGAEAIELIHAAQPDLVFLDIELQDKTGFEVLKSIQLQPYIIFTTAYDQYAIRAFEEMAIDYLLKPIGEERFAQCLEKLKRLGKAPASVDLSGIKSLMDSMRERKVPSAFSVKLRDRIILLSFSDIVFFEADDKYVQVFTNDGHKYLVDTPMNRLPEKLTPEFIRIQSL